MYEFFINTDSRTLSSVEIYADSEKGTRLNSPLDAVERFAQDVRIGFIGSAVPAADDAVKLVVAWDGVTDSVLEAQTGGATRFFIETVGARGADGRWAFKVNFASVALEEAFRAKTRLTLRAAVVVENATAATHVEYQFTLSGAASIFSGAARDPQTATVAFAKVIRLSWAEYQALPEIDAEALYVCADAPSDVEAHDADADAHAAAFERRLSGYVTEETLSESFTAFADGVQQSVAGLSVALQKKANALSVESGATASSDNVNAYLYVGPLSALGVTGAAADLNTVTFYRRANSTPNGTTPLWLRLLKKTTDADGNKAWQLVAQSTNSVAFASQTENGGACGTFVMRRVAGVEPPTCSETVAFSMVTAEDAALLSVTQFGCKVAPSSTGGVCLNWGLDLAISLDKGNNANVPLVDVTWTPYAQTGTPTAADFAALEARVAALEGA